VKFFEPVLNCYEYPWRRVFDRRGSPACWPPGHQSKSAAAETTPALVQTPSVPGPLF